MLKFNPTIRQKLIISLILAVLIPTLLVGFIVRDATYELVEDRLLSSELPAILLQINREVDGKVSALFLAAEQLAKNTFINRLLKTPDNIDASDESVLVEQLKSVYDLHGLGDASIANRDTGHYWNQGGFIRVLNPERDAWFYKFKSLGQSRMMNVYFSKTKNEHRIFVNYQDIQNNTVTGLSYRLNDMIDMINSFTLEDTGFVYLSDGSGTVQIHRNKDMVNKKSLADIYGKSISNTLLEESQFNYVQAKVDGKSKIIVSSYVPEMGWYLIGEIPRAEVFDDLETEFLYIVLMIIVVALIFVIVAVVVANSITKPIKFLARAFLDIGEGEGNLTYRIKITNKEDELGQLSIGFNSFVEKIQNAIKEVASTGGQLKEATEDIAEKSNTSLKHSQAQRDQTLQIVTAMNEMKGSVAEIAKSASQAADSAKESRLNAESGLTVVKEAQNTNNDLTREMEHVGQVIDSLAGNAEQVGSILDVIRNISEQTNLLALNAAIEAARAGEQGRGFAVVADEVRTLAGRTAASTEEIQKMINQLQEEVRLSVEAMEDSKKLTIKGSEASDRATESLVSISNGINLISDMNILVATATEEQASAVELINSNVEEINGINELTTETSEQLNDSCAELRRLASNLDAMVSQFET